jgi:ubiquinone/menaquinone biosynthesis C-methylase UbiE
MEIAGRCHCSYIKAGLLLVFCCFVLVPRAAADERDRIAEALEIEEGTVVADVGAGEGAWSVDLARRVGETGRVYATEIDPASLRDIERAVDAAGALSVTLVEGSATDTKLPAQCCDAILLRLVYHHFTDPHAMDQSMFASLRPGGLILVIDFEPGALGAPTNALPGVPEDRGGHGTPVEQVIEEMIAAGFALVRRIEDWSYREYAILFRRPE